MARRSKIEAAETRDKILKAALEVFSRKGYSNTTFVDIANELNLTKGAIYWHFKTKPELLVAMISHHDEKFCQQPLSENRLPTVADLKVKLLRNAQLIVEDVEVQKLKYFSHCQIEWSTDLMGEVKRKLDEQRGDPIEKFTRLLKELQDAGELKADADVNHIALSLASVWTGALHLALRKMCTFEDFKTLLERHFDTLIGEFATK